MKLHKLIGTTLPPSARRIAWSISSFVSPQLSPCFLSSWTSLRRNIPVTLSISCRITTLLFLFREITTCEYSFTSLAIYCPFPKALTCLLSESFSCCLGRGACNFKNIVPKNVALCFSQSPYTEQSLFWILSTYCRSYYLKVASLENVVIDKVFTLPLLPPLNLHHLLGFLENPLTENLKLENEARRGS